MKSSRMYIFVPTLVIGVLLLSVVIFRTSGILAAVDSSNEKVVRQNATLGSKFSALIASDDVLDCATYLSDGKPILPPMQDTFSLGEKISISSLNGSEYMSALWAPNGKSIVFSVPDGGVKVEQHDSLPSDGPDPLVAIGTNTLVLYSLVDGSSEQLVTLARRPMWSANSEAIYYFDNTELMKIELNNHLASDTGLSIPATGASLLFSSRLADGTLLKPKTSGGLFELGESSVASLKDIVIRENDQVLPAPNGKSLVVGQGSNTFKGVVTPAVAIFYDANGDVLPFLQNCQYSASQLVWSPASDKFAYPIHTSFPEIRIYDVQSRKSGIAIRLESFGHIGSLAWSPDGKFLLYTDIDEGSVWLVSSNGEFRERILKDGFSASWSPDGTHILFARPDGNSYSWFISEITRN